MNCRSGLCKEVFTYEGSIRYIGSNKPRKEVTTHAESIRYGALGNIADDACGDVLGHHVHRW